MRSYLAVWTILTLVASISQGCGLGTEIGNGFKEERRDEGASGGSKKANAAEDADTDGGAAPETQDEGVMSEGNGDSSDDIGSEDPSYTPDFTFDVDLLAAPCASPFGEDLQSTIRLAETTADGEINVIGAELSAGTGAWELTNVGGDPFRYVEPVTSDRPKVLPKDTDGVATGAEHQCMGSVQVQANKALDDTAGTYRRSQVTITNGSLASIVVWYTSGSAPAVLVRVTIDDVDGEDDPVILDAQ